MLPRNTSHTSRTSRNSLAPIRGLASLATLLLAPVTGQAQGTCGIAAGTFQVDGQFYSSAQTTDWAGGLGNAVFSDDGTALITPSLRARDGHWGAQGTDLDAFVGGNGNGSGNKNNDNISVNADPWTWGKGSGKAKNDLTDVMASSAIVDGEFWLFLGASTRSSSGGSHVDFEISQAGLSRIGNRNGTIVGLGPHAGRTADVDFVVSVESADGGTAPVVSFRTWKARSGGYLFVKSVVDPADIRACTNSQTVPAAPWGSVAPSGSVSMEVAPLQFVEIAVNLTGLGIDPLAFCSSPSTLMIKTRASQSFTSELKDFTMHPFSLVSPPPATITADRATYFVGDLATLCAPAGLSAGRVRFEWDGPGAPYADAACISTGLAGTYRLVVHDLWSGCSAESSFELVLRARVKPGDGQPVINTQGTTTTSSSGQVEEPAALLGGKATNIAGPAGTYLRNPNPVRGSAMIEFGMPETAQTRIMVYDVSGRVVASLVDGTVPAGHHTAPLKVGRQAGMTTGVYFVRMEARGVESGERFQHTSKLVVVR